MKTELAFSYDDSMRPTSARCKLCGQVIASPVAELTSPAEIVMQMSERFLEHKKQQHPELTTASRSHSNFR